MIMCKTTVKSANNYLLILDQNLSFVHIYYRTEFDWELTSSEISNSACVHLF